MSKLIFANWKMNPATEEEALTLAKESDQEGLVICPPFVFLEKIAAIINNSRLGAQDLALEKSTGPYTGEVSAKELKSVGVDYVIIGHSERRYPSVGEGESDEIVARKFKAAVQVGLVPILCVGETQEEKDNNQQRSVLKREIGFVFESLKSVARVYIAYEPVWAISSQAHSQADKPEDVVGAVKYIKKLIKEINKDFLEHAHFIYGGSVTAKNADKFLQYKEIEGALVGHASLNAEEIKKIVQTAANY